VREADLVVYYQYDDVDRLTGEVWRQQSDGDQIYGFWYEYDAGHNRVKMRRESSAGVEAESAYYGYDEANAPGGTGLGRMRPVSREVYTPPSAQVDTYYYYDENGSLVREVEAADTTYFEYGPHGLITRIAPPTGNPWNFYYDGQLNRYCIDKGGEATYYLWDGLNLLEERAADGSLLARYTHGPYRQYGIGSVVEVERNAGGATYYQYLVLDHRGTAYKVADSEGDTQVEYALDAFGRQLAAPIGLDPNVPNELIYQTNWLTIKVGGAWYGLSRFRLYDAANGVFLRRDFLSYLNRYRCWSNNPPGQVDRDGLASAAQQERPVPEVVVSDIFTPTQTGEGPYTAAGAGGGGGGEPGFTVVVESEASRGVRGGVLVLGIEMYAAGHLRAEYDRMVEGLRNLGLTQAEAEQAREELKKLFRDKQNELADAVVKRELAARAKLGLPQGKRNPYKPNTAISGKGKVFCKVGGVMTFVALALDVIDISSAPPDERAPQAARTAGRWAGAAAGGKLGMLYCAWGGPWGVGICGFLGAAAGALAGEAAVDLVLSGKRRPPEEVMEDVKRLQQAAFIAGQSAEWGW
jgi:hypothetical protein